MSQHFFESLAAETSPRRRFWGIASYRLALDGNVACQMCYAIFVTSELSVIRKRPSWPFLAVVSFCGCIWNYWAVIMSEVRIVEGGHTAYEEDRIG
jgi:hypothetical protein